MEALKDRRILVTGASGFIGSRLVEKLAIGGSRRVSALVRSPEKAKYLKLQAVRQVVADLANKRNTDRVLEGQHTVINLAYDFRRSGKHNLRCFKNLTEACIRYGIKHFVHTSSIVVYDDWPFNDVSEESVASRAGNDYKDAKYAMEDMLAGYSRAGSLFSTILQPTIVYGPYSWLWTDHVVEKLVHGKLVLPAGEEGICNAVYVDDVADALLLAAVRSGASGEKFIISGPAPTTWREFYESYNRFLGLDSIVYADLDELRGGPAGLSGAAKKIVTNPMLLAELQPFRGALNLLRGILGERAIEALKSGAYHLRRGASPALHYPSESELDLYTSTGVCSISKAGRLLGYTPKFPFGPGFDLTASYLEKKLERS